MSDELKPCCQCQTPTSGRCKNCGWDEGAARFTYGPFDPKELRANWPAPAPWGAPPPLTSYEELNATPPTTPNFVTKLGPILEFEFDRLCTTKARHLVDALGKPVDLFGKPAEQSLANTCTKHYPEGGLAAIKTRTGSEFPALTPAAAATSEKQCPTCFKVLAAEAAHCLRCGWNQCGWQEPPKNVPSNPFRLFVALLLTDRKTLAEVQRASECSPSDPKWPDVLRRAFELDAGGLQTRAERMFDLLWAPKS